MTPSEVATVVALAQKGVKDGRTGIVSNPSGSSPASSPLQAILNGFAGAGKVLVDLSTKVFNPATAQADATIISSSIAKGITNVSRATVKSVTSVTNGAAQGVKTGLQWGVFAIIIVAGIWVYSKVK